MKMFGDRLADAVRDKKTPAMVGIDPRPDLLPYEFVERFQLGADAPREMWANAVEEFCSRVLDVVCTHVPVVKFQSAFFEVYRASGITVLESLMVKARRLGLITVLDAKRGDIGSTSVAYAESVFGSLSNGRTDRNSEPLADALTVNPYMGKDSLEPFLEYARRGGCGLFVLVRTSNPGSRDLQQLVTCPADQAVYRVVADWTQEWSSSTRGESGYGSVGAVVGATAGEQIAELRAALPGTWLLIPGYGAQGATASDIASAFDADGLGAIINNSREILFPRIDGDPSKPHAWERSVEAALRRMIDDLARHTRAGRLTEPALHRFARAIQASPVK